MSHQLSPRGDSVKKVFTSVSHLTIFRSLVSRNTLKIPVSTQPQFLSRPILIQNVKNPYQYSNKVKWVATLLVAGAVALDPLSGTIFYPALPMLLADLHISALIANLTVSPTNLCVAIGPLWWSSFSRKYGRRTILVASLVLYILFSTLAARSTSIEMLITMRVLASAVGSAGESVSAETVTDMWETKVRGRAMCIFFPGPMIRVALGPVLDGLLVQKWSWLATLWFLKIYATALCMAMVLCLLETLQVQDFSTNTAGKDRQAKAKSPNHIQRLLALLRETFLTPLTVLTYLRFPAICITVFLAISLQQTFSRNPYRVPASTLGLAFIPLSLGMVGASVVGGRWSDHIMTRKAIAKSQSDDERIISFQPEDRIRENAFLAFAMLAPALAWYGWSTERGDNWIIPLISVFFIGAGIMTIYGIITTVLTEYVPYKSASLMALNSLGCNIVMTISTIATEPLLSSIKCGWLFTILSFIIVANSITIVIVKKFGPKWRVSMNRTLGTESDR